jgi:hypothetical protein
LNDEIVLNILNNGECSDIDIDEVDENFCSQQSVSEDEALDEEPSCSSGSKKRGSSLIRQNQERPQAKKQKKKMKTKQKRQFKVKFGQRRRIWKKCDYFDKPHEYSGHPKPCKIRSPVEYFFQYYDDDFYQNMAVCTSLYYMRHTGRVLTTNKQEMKRLYGIHLLMGILSYPRYAMYWRRNISINMITSAMTRDRMALLRNNLHVVDTDTVPVKDTGNPLWKVQPVLDAVKKGCEKILRVPDRYSVDEQMIPFTGKCHFRQLVKNKPRPVGLKNFVVTTSEGLMVDFEIYYGNNPALCHPLGLGPAVVLRLIQSVPRGSCIFFDRYFTTVPLLDTLIRLGYHGTGTIMSNRVPDRKELNLKEDSKMNRGDIDQRISGDIALVKWKDSKAVLTASNCTGGTAIEIVQRYDKKNKCYIDVDAPKLVKSYNSFMGGVDVLDQSMEYYRTFIKTRKWTLKVILHFMDLAIVNAWRLYRCDLLATGASGKDIKDLLSFRFEIAETLINTPDKEQRPSSPDNLIVPRANTGRYKPANNPSVGKRYDGYMHLPIFDELKDPRVCRLESCKSRTKIRCRKCDVYLCMSRGKDCFYLYHVDS